MGPTIPAQPNSISDPGGKAASSGSGSSSTSANSSSIEAQTGNNSSEAGETVVSGQIFITFEKSWLNLSYQLKI